MEDKKMFKVALITTIFGMLGLIFTANQINPQIICIKDINRGTLDKEVFIEGVVQGVSKSRNTETYFLELMDGTGKIQVVVFQSTALNLQNNNKTIQNFKQRRVRVVGRITEYKGQYELVLKDASSLKLIS